LDPDLLGKPGGEVLTAYDQYFNSALGKDSSMESSHSVLSRREMLKMSAALAGAGILTSLKGELKGARQMTDSRAAAQSAQTSKKKINFVLSHEQFPGPKLVEFAVAAEKAGFDAVSCSDHFHPWQDNEVCWPKTSSAKNSGIMKG
jgi:hypothetical protein